METPFEDKFKTRPYPAQEIKDPEAIGLAGETMPYRGITSPVDERPSGQSTKAYSETADRVTRTSTHNLGVGDTVELNSIRYEINGILSAEGKTAEAVIYKVADPKNQTFVLKLYYQFTDEHLEPNSDTLQRIREIHADGLLYLFDFGTGPNKHLEKFCFEISGFAAGGDLLSVEDIQKKYSIDFLGQNVIPSIHNGIRALHHERIYHCDLKPQNVFFIDEEQTKVVIGDYGSAKSFDKASEKELSYTTMTRGTEFYLAPEQAFGIVSEKNDYYSLGMIVLHLLYPEEVNRKNLRKIFERRTKGLPIIDFDERYERFNRLIEGLTLQDYNNRWGAEQLEAWMAGEDVPVNYGGSATVTEIIIGDTIIKSGIDLVNFIRSSVDAYNLLIDGQDGYGKLLAWIRSMQGERGMKTFDDMISHYKRHFGVEYVKEAIYFYFDPAHKISVGQDTFDISASKNPEEQVREFFSALDNIWKITGFETVRRYFFRFEFALRRLRMKADSRAKQKLDSILESVSQIVETKFIADFSDMKADMFIRLENNHLPELFHHFSPGRGFLDMRGNKYETLFEVCEFLKSNPVKDTTDLLQYEKSAYIKTRERDEFIEFVEFCDDLTEFFFEQDDDLELLAQVVSELGRERYSLKLIKTVLRFYRNAGLFVVREVVLRLITPEQPLEIGGSKIHLFNPGDFDQKINEFFVTLESLRFSASIESVRKHFFGFEFALMQVALNDQLVGKSLAEPVFHKINAVLQGNFPDWKRLRAAFYRGIDEKNLVGILHQFNPSRVFCTHNGDFLGTVEEMALYYLENPERFDDEKSGAEREAFLKKSGNRRLIRHSLTDFVLNIFRSETSLDAVVQEIRLDENQANEVAVYYDYEISLEEFLSSKGINSDVSYKSPSTREITFKKKALTNREELFGQFAGALKRKHTFKQLTDETRSSFQEAFNKTRHDERLGSILLVPRYMLYLLPAFGLLFFSAAYLSDYSFFKQLSYRLAPSLNLVAVRIAETSLSSLLFAAYFLNLIVAMLLLIPMLSLRRKKLRFEQFSRDYAPMVSRMTLILVFAPVVFIGIYSVLEPVFGTQIYSGSGSFPAISTLNFAVFLYIIFMFLQELFVISAFFRVSKKIRLAPLAISLTLYLLTGYFAIFKYSLI